MGVFTHKKRAADPQAGPVVTNRLGNGQDMGLIKGALFGRTAMAAGAEMDQLLRVARVRPALVILAHEPVDVDQQLRRGRLTG